MITTDFVPGSPSWLDLGAPDVAEAAAFYSGIFGWELRSLGPDAGAYGIFELAGRPVAGIGPLTEAGALSAWMVYFTAADAQAAAHAVEEAGGTVRMPPTDVGGNSLMAQLSDPAGGQFAVYQPAPDAGIRAADEPGALAWVELCTTDAAGAREFYGAVFGWQTEPMPMPGGGDYTMLTPAGEGSERMHGGIAQVEAGELLLTGGSRPYWHPVFQSADCDATVADVRARGGGVAFGPKNAEDVGRLAVCHDPAGAEFVVLTPTSGES